MDSVGRPSVVDQIAARSSRRASLARRPARSASRPRRTAACPRPRLRYSARRASSVAVHAPVRSCLRCSRSLASSIQPSAASGPGAVTSGSRPRRPRLGGRSGAAAEPTPAWQGPHLDRRRLWERRRSPGRRSLRRSGHRDGTAAPAAPDPGRRPAPFLAHAVAAFEVCQDAPERDHVLGVVAGYHRIGPAGPPRRNEW